MNLKETVKNCIIKYQENLINGLNEEFQLLKGVTNIDENDVRDSDTHSHQSQSTRDEQRVSDQLSRAQSELEKIKAISVVPTNEVTEGTLIETKNLLIHVGIVTSKFNDGGKDIIGISTDSPFFKTLQGQKVGFPFQFAGIDCSIISIY